MYRVLLVDDEPIILSGLKALIKWEEFGLNMPDTAANAQEALLLMEEGLYDILLTDVRMPGMSGIALIAEMRRRGYCTKILIISGYDDFEYIKSAMHYQIENYIVKPVDENELKSTLLQVVNKIESEQSRTQVRQMMNSMLLDNVLSSWALMTLEESALQERLKLFHISLDHDFYTLMIVRMNRVDQTNTQINMSCDCIRGLFRQLCREDEDLHATFNLSGDLLLIHASRQRPSEIYLRNLLQTAMDCWLKNSSSEWVATIGDVVERPMLLKQSYQHAMQLLFYPMVLRHEQIVLYSEQQKRCHALQRQTGLELEWLHDFLDTDEGEISDKLVHLEQTLIGVFEGTEASRDLVLADILYLILGNSKAISDRIHGNEPLPLNFSSLFMLRTPQEKRLAMGELIRKYAQLYPHDALVMHPLVSRMLKCIEEDFAKDLSLKGLANDFNVSQTYLGRIFKKETGELFTDYLTEFRIEKAKELLNTTPLRSSDVAIQVGFNNPNYFANVFKKRVGVYPTKYRQNAGTGEG